MTERKNTQTVERNALAEHVTECEVCRREAPDVAAVSSVLRASTVDVEAGLLSRSIVEHLRPELARRAAAAFRRRVAVGLLAALVPLPLVLIFDAYVLRALFWLVSLLVPTALAAYMVASYGVFLLLMMAVVYGAIPLLVERQAGIQTATTSGG